MRHATVEDAFNAASGFTRQTLGILTKEKEYELDTKLFQQSIELEKVQRELLADFTRIDESSGENVFQQNPEAYQRHVQERLAEWRGKADAAGNGSKYFTDRLNRMDQQGSETMRQKAVALLDETNRQREDIDHAKIYATIDNGNFTPQEALKLKMAELNRYKNKNAMNPVEEYKEKTLVFNSEFNNLLKVDIGNRGLEELLKEIDERAEGYEGAAAPYFAEGESLDGFLEDKEKKIADAKNAVKNAVWNRNYNYWGSRHNEYTRMLHEAQRSEDPALIREVLNLHRRGSAERQRALIEAEKENGDYNVKDRDQIAQWFPAPYGLTDGRSGSGDMARRIQELRDYRARGAAEGRTSQEEARSLFIQDCGTLAMEMGMHDEQGRPDIDRFERMYSREMSFIDMYEDMKGMLVESNPLYKDAIKSIDNFINDWTRRARPNQQAIRKWQGEQIAAYLYDTVLDTSGLQRLPPAQVQQEAMRVASLLVGGEINFIKQTADNSNRYTGGNSDSNFGKAIHEISQNPWARFTQGGSAFTFGDSQYMQDIQNVALDKFSAITGIPLANLNINGHVKEGMFDETAEFTIQVIGRGNENNTYRFAGDQRGNYHIERQTDNGWERDPRYNRTAQEAENQRWEQLQERHAEAVRQEEQAAVQRYRQNILEMARNEEDPDRRRIIVQNAQMGHHAIPHDEFWKEGINPNSGDQAAEIPARDWDRIIGNIPTAAQQEAQKRRWQAMGITRRER